MKKLREIFWLSNRYPAINYYQLNSMQYTLLVIVSGKEEAG